MRLVTSFVYAIASGGAVAIVFVIRNVVQSVGHTGPTPIMVMLLYDLLLAVALLFLLNLLAMWFPQFDIFKKLLDKAAGHLVPIAIISFAFVLLGIAAGIGFALGIF